MTDYPSVAQLLVPTLQEAFPDSRVLVDLPTYAEAGIAAASLDGVVQIRRFGGSVPFQGMQMSFVDFDVWSLTLQGADELACSVFEFVMHRLQGVQATSPSGNGTFANTRALSTPHDRPAGNPDLRRVGFAVGLSVHRA